MGATEDENKEQYSHVLPTTKAEEMELMQTYFESRETGFFEIYLGKLWVRHVN
ncbi:MAG: hypothetical protein ACRDBO_14330 [Lachnospiraceae bacterium]